MSTSSPTGASTRLATFRATLPRFHATFSARETIRWIWTMVWLQALGGKPAVERVEMLRLETVEPVLSELGDYPAPDLRLIGTVQRALGDGTRRDGRQPCLEPASHGELPACLARTAFVSLALEVLDLARGFGFTTEDLIQAVGG
jgi:hypothetical protein